MQKSLNFFGIAVCTKSRISRTSPFGPVTRSFASNISRLFFEIALMTLIRQPGYEPSRHGLARLGGDSFGVSIMWIEFQRSYSALCAEHPATRQR